jgi:predicted MFS family arabinose efflux permease
VSGDASPRTGRARAILTCFLPFALGYLFSYVLRIVNAVVGPRIAADLDIDLAALGVLTSAYFAGFVLLQIPAGISLDRYGPRLTQTVLLLVASAGALLFALGDSLAALVIGRFVIGVGVATCLMAGFKANTLFWPAERLGLANGTLLAFAGIGGAFGTIPVTWLADALSWRAAFVVLAIATAAIAALVFLAVPDRRSEATTTLSQALAGTRLVFATPLFWRVVPLSAATQGAFQAYHTLWTATWLADVAGFEPGAIAAAMFIILLGIIPGYLLSGTLTDLAARHRIDKAGLYLAYCGAFIAVQCVLALGPRSGALVLWLLFVVLGTGNVIGYVLLTQSFAPALTGRVNTAINLVAFGFAFLLQAAIGYALAWFAAGGLPIAHAHGRVMWCVIVLQVAGWIWLALAPRRPRAVP